MLEELRIVRHDVFEVAVLLAVLDHEYLAVALDNLSLDLADLFVQQDFVLQFPVDDLLTNLGDALRTQRICGARPAQWRFSLLVRLQKRFLSPLGRERRSLLYAVHPLKDCPGPPSSVSQTLLRVFHRFMHFFFSSCA